MQCPGEPYIMTKSMSKAGYLYDNTLVESYFTYDYVCTFGYNG